MNVIIDHVPLIDGLKPNLINISQIGDKVINACFTNKACVVNEKIGNMDLIGNRKENAYIVDFNKTYMKSTTRLFNKANMKAISEWYKKLYHLNFKSNYQFSKKEPC